MEQKKAGIPLIALVIFFALIVGIIATCLIILSTNKTSNDTKQIQLSSNTTEPQNAIVNDIEPDPVVEEEGKEVNVNTADVINPYKLAGNYDTAAKYAMYANGDFTSGDANVELKLKIAFAQFTNDELSSGTVTKASVEEKLKKVFGSADGVTMQTVTMFSDYNFKTDYPIISFDYDQASESFKVVKSTVENTDPTFITEVVNKAVSYSDRLEIYVTPLYIQVTDYHKDNANSKAYSIYSAYNFSTQAFDKLLIPVLKEDYVNAFTSGDTLDIDGLNYTNLRDQIEKNGKIKVDIGTLQQYKYILAKNGENYTLSSFVKVTPETERKDKPQENKEENTTDANTTNQTSENATGEN